MPTFLLAKDPRCDVLCISNSEALAEGFSRRRRAIFETKEWRNVAKSRLAPDAKSLGYTGTVEGGGVHAHGQGSVISGLRCDWLISDDLISGVEQANSLTQLDKIWQWYLSEARSRLKPNGKEIVVATRWSQLDPLGRIEELVEKGFENWTQIRIPMESDSTDDPLGRQPGERLWSDWYTLAMVQEAKRESTLWQTLYQQRPLAASGEWVDPTCWQIDQIRPKKPYKIIFGLDLALSIQKGDFTVIAVCAITPDGHLHLIDLYRQQVSPETSAQKMLELCKLYRPAHIVADDDNSTKMWMRLAVDWAKRQGIPLPMKLTKMSNKDKEMRAAPLRGFAYQARCHILQKSWTSDVLDELSKFPGGRHDDIVDAFALVARDLPQTTPTLMVRPKPQPIPVQMIGSDDGRIFMNGTLDELFEQREYGRERFQFQKMRRY